MMRYLSLFLSLAVMVAGPCIASGDVATLALDPDATTITPTDPFTVQVNLTVDEPCLGVGFVFQEPTSAGFELTGYDRSDHPFTVFTSFEDEILDTAEANNVLNPGNGRDLGGLAPGSLTGVPADTYNLGKYTFSAADVPLGTYEIGVAGPTGKIQAIKPSFDPETETFELFGSIQLDTTTVTVVPEPGSLALLSIAAVFTFGWWRRGWSRG